MKIIFQIFEAPYTHSIFPTSAYPICKDNHLTFHLSYMCEGKERGGGKISIQQTIPKDEIKAAPISKNLPQQWSIFDMVLHFLTYVLIENFQL